jgi:hypothetical protein
MSFHRAILGACIAVFATAFASAAFAQCGGCGMVAVGPPVAVAPPLVQPVAVVQEVIQPVVAIPQVIPAVPIAPAPIAVDRWDTNGWGCGGCGGCGRCGGCGGCGYRPVAALAPFYTVNQGPAYTGPGVMVPYGTYSAATGLAVPGAYPYIAGSRYPYYRPRYAYRRPYIAPYRYYSHRWRG